MSFYKGYRWDEAEMCMSYAKMTNITVRIRKAAKDSWVLSTDWGADNTVEGSLDDAKEAASKALTLWGEVSDRID